MTDNHFEDQEDNEKEAEWDDEDGLYASDYAAWCNL